MECLSQTSQASGVHLWPCAPVRLQRAIRSEPRTVNKDTCWGMSSVVNKPGRMIKPTSPVQPMAVH